MQNFSKNIFSLHHNYRYAYNGMETDHEVSGHGNSYTTQFRQYDPRLGRWKSLDPLANRYYDKSPFEANGNNPVYFIDTKGDAPVPPGKGGFNQRASWNGIPFNYNKVSKIEVNNSGNVFGPGQSIDPNAALYWGQPFQTVNLINLNTPTHIQNKLMRKLNNGTFIPRDANSPNLEINNSVYLNSTLSIKFTGIQVGQVIVIESLSVGGLGVPVSTVTIVVDESMIDENGNLTYTHTMSTTRTAIDDPSDPTQSNIDRQNARQNQITNVNVFVLGTGVGQQRETVKISSFLSVSARSGGRVNPHRNGAARRRSKYGGKPVKF